MSPIPILSFFTGGGFLDMGFESEGFPIVWCNDNNTEFKQLYDYGYTTWRQSSRIHSTLRHFETRSIACLKREDIIDNAFNSKVPRCFGIIGSPPCPDFSRGGKHAGHRGENGRLTKYYVRLISSLLPSFFVLENVSGLMRYRKHRQFLSRIENRLNRLGYTTDCHILNALELGVPQYRERLFLIGFKQDIIKDTIYAKKIESSESWFPWPKVRKYENAMTRYKWGDLDLFGVKPRKPYGTPIELCVEPYMIENSSISRIPNARHFFSPHSSKFLEICEGDTRPKSFKRLHRYRYSPTACYGNNEVHLHPWEPRRLSLREAMRIQGIPDSYILPESTKLTPAFKMIANGVPYPMSRMVAQAVRKVLRKTETDI